MFVSDFLATYNTNLTGVYALKVDPWNWLDMKCILEGWPEDHLNLTAEPEPTDPEQVAG